MENRQKSPVNGKKWQSWGNGKTFKEREKNYLKRGVFREKGVVKEAGHSENRGTWRKKGGFQGNRGIRGRRLGK